LGGGHFRHHKAGVNLLDLLKQIIEALDRPQTLSINSNANSHSKRHFLQTFDSTFTLAEILEQGKCKVTKTGLGNNSQLTTNDN